MNTYARLPITFTHGEGVWLWGSDGKRYMDGLAGIAVNTLGHAHPRLTAALTQQINKLMHVSNLYQIDEQEAVADQLCALSKMQEVFLCNSGCEANEAAIKLARLYGHQQGIENPAIIVMEKAFHGRTLDVHYLEQLRGICDQHNWLLMLDEVQCGIGRTGKWFAHQHSSVLPDVMTLAKGMGSGVPVGACLAAGKVTGTFKPGNHGSTFGGNPLACVAVLTTLDVIQQDRLVANAATVGSLIQQELRTRLTTVAGVVDIRGQGLIIGIELDRPCGDLVNQALAQGLLINVTAENVIRLLPPLVLTSSEALQLLDKLCPLIVNFLTQDV